MKKKKNILICPLEWGLGHSGRMIALAEKLQESDFNIIFGAGKKQLAFLRNEMTGCNYISFPGFRPLYSGFLPQYLVIFFQIPLLIYHSIREHLILKKLISDLLIDIVISDNRFGLWNKNIQTIYITHQLRIPFPRFFSFLESTGTYLHGKIISKYSLCFIPDLPGDLNLTGKLTHGLKLPYNVRFIGILSRFRKTDKLHSSSFPKEGMTTVILSGPESQRSILEKKLINNITQQNLSAVILGGKPHENTQKGIGWNITYYSHADRMTMQKIISESKIIITRAGYTTIMELVSMECSAVLIPTPGQTEQEYIAMLLSDKGWFSCIPQNKLNGKVHFNHASADWCEEIIKQSKELLDKALKELSEQTKDK